MSTPVHFALGGPSGDALSAFRAAAATGTSPAGSLLEQAQTPAVITLIAGGVALLVVLVGGTPWRRARNVVTMVHEAGHALAAVLVGRRLQGIKLHSDTSGVTVSRGKPEGPGMAFTAMAGYLAPSVLGLVFAGLLGADLVGTVLVLIALLLLGVLVMVRNAYGVFTVVASAAVLALIAFVAPVELQAPFSYLVTWFLLFGGVRPVAELQIKRRRGQARDSDADQLGRLTAVPPVLWVLVFAVATISCLIAGALWLLEPVAK
ncbi:M50 family metallopeptidase [Amycolatopsis sp. DG1A-15b]|uniref:M50 family metallopeptidase n=1 Tax=Amycolatopsis sp. DG1A-15b TaxID=3052846 RepID=UPI00255BEB92|nr:M50 family metallopeptidase [Amycolatopsis sp. DG1A-15b]WIX84743.1 M50 family metallopeptidase [Amycolatopsis sp. DG1A-15b]